MLSCYFLYYRYFFICKVQNNKEFTKHFIAGAALGAVLHIQGHQRGVFCSWKRFFSSMHSVELTLIEGIHFRSNLKIAQNNGSVKWTMTRVTCF